MPERREGAILGVDVGGTKLAAVGAGLLATHMLDLGDSKEANRDTPGLMANRGVQ